MGLLDGQLDPQSASVLALAGGLLSPGSFGQGLSRGIAGQQSVLANDAELQLKRQQLADAQQNQQIRDLSMQQMRQKLQFGQQFLGDAGGAQAPTQQAPQGPSAATTALGEGASMGSVGPTPDNAARLSALPSSAPPLTSPTTVTPQAKSRLASLTQDQVAAGVVSGVIPKEFVELWTNAKFGRALPPGWKQNLDGSMTYIPDPTKGVTMGADGTVQTMPGAAKTLGDLAAATKGGEMRATNANTLIPLDRIDRGLPAGLTPNSSVADLLNPPSSSASATPLMRAQLPTTQQKLVADSAAQGFDPRTLKINGQPAFGGSTAPSGFKSPADLAAETLQATQGVHATTDPLVKFNTDRLVNAHAGVQAAYDKLSDTVRSEAELQNRNAQLYPLLDKIKTGGFGAEQRIGFANALQTSGLIPDFMKGTVNSFAKTIAGGDPTAGKVLENQLAAAALKTMLDNLDKEGKPNRAIYTALQKEQESARSGNATLSAVFGLQKQLYDWHYQQEQELGNKMAAPDYNPITTLRDFSQARNATIKTPAAAPVPTMRWNPQTQKIEAVQ